MAPMPRCWDGEKCKKSWCRFIHPGEPGYEDAPMSRAHKEKLKEEGGGHGSHRDSGYSRPRSKNDSGRSSTGWDAKPASPRASGSWGSGGWGNASPAGGGGSGGWGSASPAPAPAGGGWGNSSPAPSTWGKSASPAHGGWGESSTTTTTGWGTGESSAGTGWGNSESSRRTSGQFGDKSSAKLPPSSPRGGRTVSPTRPPSGDRGRERERDSGRDRDRESRHGSGSPSHHRSRRSSEKTSSHSTRDRDRSPDKRRESTDTRKQDNTGDAMDVDLPPLPPAAPTSAKPPTEPGANSQTPASATTSMLPPPLPPAAALKPLNAATAPLAKAPPPGGASSTLPPPLPTPASAPITAPAPKPITAPAPAAIAPAAPRPPASPAAPVTQPPTAPRASVPAVQQPPPPAPPVDDVPSVAQAQEWVGLLDTLLEHRRKHEHLKQREKNLENAEKHRTVPNLNRRPEADTTAMLAATRTEINTLQQSIQTLAERFAISMKAMQVHTTVASTNRTEAGTSLVTTSVPALAGIGPESISQMLSLENTVSKMQSELKLIEAEMASVGDNAKETAKSKEEVRGVKEGLRKEVENRAKEVGEVKKEATAANDKLGEMKRELEGMKMDVGNAYRGLGETKQEVGKVKSQQEMLRAAVERVEQELGDAQKWHGDASVEVERQFKALKQEIAQLRARVQEKGGPEERTKSGKREREASASVPSADAMDVDEVRPVKRVRLSVASAPEDEEPLPAGLTQDIGGPSNERLKEMVDQVQDYIATLENEMVQHHTDTRELLEEFAERIGWEPAALSRGFGAEPAASTRAESAPPPKSPSKLATASGVRSSAPPDISAERTTIIKPSLETLEEGEVASPQELGTDALAPVRKDVENIMEQLLQLWAAKGQWPEIIGRNLAAASGAESLDQVWEKTKTSSGANGLKQVNGTGAHKGQEDVMALVKSMQAEQAKMAQRMADMEVKTSRVEAEKEVMRTKIAEQEKEMNELRSILNDAFKPTNSANEIVDYAVRTDSTPLQQEVEGIKHLAEILPSLLKLADVSAKS